MDAPDWRSGGSGRSISGVWQDMPRHVPHRPEYGLQDPSRPPKRGSPEAQNEGMESALGGQENGFRAKFWSKNRKFGENPEKPENGRKWPKTRNPGKMVKMTVSKFEISPPLLGVRIVAALRRASCIKKWSIGADLGPPPGGGPEAPRGHFWARARKPAISTPWDPWTLEFPRNPRKSGVTPHVGSIDVTKIIFAIFPLRRMLFRIVVIAVLGISSIWLY